VTSKRGGPWQIIRSIEPKTHEPHSITIQPMRNQNRLSLKGDYINLGTDMKSCVFLIFGCFVFAASAQPKVLYENNFEKAAVGALSEDFLVLDGAFEVKQDNGNKFLELPGAPLDSYAVQFGPAESENVYVSARIKGTAKGRRYPIFGIGLNGVAGFKLQVSPAKKELQLLKDQATKAGAPFEWKSGAWTHLKLAVRKTKENEWKIQGKTWFEGASEPQEWIISYSETEAPITGKASVFGSPFSGMPIQFDDLLVSEL
jgi:hypothetical protein